MTDILFLPVSGPTGYGEYARSLIIAEGLAASDPALKIAFGLSQNAPYFKDCPWPVHALADTPTRDTPGVHALLDQLKPRMVIFDSCGRSHQYKTAQRAGIRVGFVSSRPASRRRVFSLSRIGKIDLGMLIGDPATQAPGLGLFERLRLALFGRKLQVIHAGPIFLPAQTSAVEVLKQQHPEGFALFVPGGGGTGDHTTLGHFHRAAIRFAQQTQARVLLILGPNSTLESPEEAPANLTLLQALSPQDFIDHLAASRMAVTGGGSVLSQSFALGVPSVGIALGASDQEQRVRGLSVFPGVMAAPVNDEAIAQAAQQMWQDSGTKPLAPPVRPGLPTVVNAIQEQLRKP